MNSFLPSSGRPRPEPSESCAQVAPLLVALFDGETDENGAKRARRHLLVCPFCARAWQSWSENRQILQSLETPAVPPFLLWRVLLSCRFSSWKARLRLDFWNRKPTPSQLGALYSLFEPREAPSTLRAQILAQTTRRENPKPEVAPRSRPARPRLAFSALMVPALGAFLLFASHSLDIFGSPSPSLTARPLSSANALSTVSSARPSRRKIGAPIVRAPQILPVRAPEAVQDLAPIAPLPQARSFETGDNGWREELGDLENEQQRVLASVEAAPVSGGATEKVVEKAEKAFAALPPLPEIRVPRRQSAPIFQGELSEKGASAPRPRLALASRRPSSALALAAFDSTASPTRVARPALGAPALPVEVVEGGDENLHEIQAAVQDFRASLAVDEEPTDLASEIAF